MQHCDQRQALKQYGAGRTVIVLSMVLVQGLCVTWVIAAFNFRPCDVSAVKAQLHFLKIWLFYGD